MSNVVHAIIITALIFFVLSIFSVALIMAQWFFKDFLQIEFRIEKFLAERRYKRKYDEWMKTIRKSEAYKTYCENKSKGAE